MSSHARSASGAVKFGRGFSTPMLLGIASVGALALAACSSGGTDADSDAKGDSDVKIVATTTQIGSVAEQIVACGGGEVQTLMGPGDDPHQFSVSSSEVTDMTKADIVLTNGLSLESTMESSLENAEDEGAHIYEVAEHVDPLPFGDDHHHDHDHDHGHDHDDEHGDDDHDHDHDHDGHDHDDHADEHDDHDHDHDHDGDDHDHDGHDHGGDDHHGHVHGDWDPHFWMDVGRMAEAAENIGEELAEVTGDDNYNTCAAEVAKELKDTDQELRDIFAELDKEEPTLVTDHAAYAYMADAYGLEITGVVIPGGSTEGEASSRDIAELEKQLSDDKVDALVTSVQTNNPVIEALADEGDHGVPLVKIYESGLGEEGSGAETYQDAMIFNAQEIVDAVNGK